MSDVGEGMDLHPDLSRLVNEEPTVVRERCLDWVRQADEVSVTRILDEALQRGRILLARTAPGDLTAVRHLIGYREATRVLADRLRGGHDELDADELGELRRQANWMIHLDPSADASSRAAYESLADEIHRQTVVDLDRALHPAAFLESPHRVLVRLAHEQAEFAEKGREHLLVGRDDAILDALAGSPTSDHPILGRRLVEAARDLAEDVLHRVAGISPRAGARRLEIARRLLIRLHGWADSRALRAESKGIGRELDRLTNAIQENIVEQRQVAQIGRMGLRVVETTNVLLVLSVLGIISVLSFTNPSAERLHTLAWLDVGICGFFLAEFTWRWTLAPGKWRYFRRNAWIDVLPSLPFGLLDILSIGSATTLGASRTLRLHRLIRLLPYVLRTLRPAIRGFRLLLFAIRGMDRLIRRVGAWIDRDIIFFEGGRDPGLEPSSATERAEEFDRRATRRIQSVLATAHPDQRAPLLSCLLELTARQLNQERSERPPRVSVSRDRSIRVEVLLHRMLHTEPEDVEDGLGRPFAHRVVRTLQLFDLPLLRSLPILRAVLPPLRGNDAVRGLADATRALGLVLERMLATIRFVGDLTGIITGPQLLDRIGTTLVKMTQRPSTRLLLFGVFGFVLEGLIGLFPGTALDRLRSLVWLIVEPLLILGGVCLVIQILGRWLKKLAGEAGDLFRKVAEAQGINLLKLHKLANRRQDVNMLFDRVVAPEVTIDGRPGDLERERTVFREERPEDDISSRALTGYPFRRDRTLLLYQDYLDGAVLHHSDTRTTEQFLGNLDLEAIRRLRMRITKREEKRLAALDLTRVRPIPTGPYLWFRFITESLAQKTARLVLDYNRSAIPLAHRHLVPKSRLQGMQTWLERRGRETRDGSTARLLVPSAVGGCFNSLHFLAGNPRMDAQVQREFGDALLDRLQQDRRQLIREVFGSYPFERLPRHRRTFNAYRFYFSWFGSGRFLYAVPRFLWSLTRILAKAIVRLARVVQEQLHPERHRARAADHYAPRAVVIRKINRMRKPVFLAALDLRARFDPEYLGVPLPGQDLPPPSLATIERDLDLVGAPASERTTYDQQRQRVEAEMSRLRAILVSLGWPETDVVHAVDPTGPAESGVPPLEALRAVAIAYTIDYEGCRTLLHGADELGDWLREVLASPPPVRPRSRLLMRRATRILARARKLIPDDVPRPHDLNLLRGLIAADRDGFQRQLRALDSYPTTADARRAALATLAEVARYPMPWSQQLVTLRAVQSLTCLDITSTRRVVESLGAFSE